MMQEVPPVNLDSSGRDTEIAHASEEQSNRNMWERFRRWGIIAVTGAQRLDIHEVNQLLMDLEDGKAPKPKID